MSKLFNELQRLYFLQEQQSQCRKSDQGDSPASASASASASVGVAKVTPELVATSLEGETTVALNLVSPTGMARTMIVGFERAADWTQVARLYQGIQEELELPAPAVSASGRAGYQLWFSLAECVPVAQVHAFLDAIRCKYLADLPLASLKFCPDAGEISANLVPAIFKASGKWSAFIDPTMGAMFVDEPGLGTAPNMDRQADILAGLESIKAEDFQRVLNNLQSQRDAVPARAEGSASEKIEGAGETVPGVGRMCSKLNVGNHYTDPKDFLLAVMNDPSASADQRIDAAKALLPYFNGMESKST